MDSVKKKKVNYSSMQITRSTGNKRRPGSLKDLAALREVLKLLLTRGQGDPKTAATLPLIIKSSPPPLSSRTKGLRNSDPLF
jgi:hypothetical protein